MFLFGPLGRVLRGSERFPLVALLAQVVRVWV